MSDPIQVQLVNTALSDLGQEPVSDLTPDSLAQSNAAVKLLRVLDTARDVVLARHGWTCALEYVALQPATLPPAYQNFRYPTSYLLPADALRVWEIAGVSFNGNFNCWAPRWQVGTTEISGSPQIIIRATGLVNDGYGFGYGFLDSYIAGWSTAPSSSDPDAQVTGAPLNLGPLDVAYVRRAAYGALDMHVRDAIAHTAAARAAYSITGDSAKAKAMMQEAEAAVLLAVSAEGAQEGLQDAAAPSIPLLLRQYARY
jgi:hypothetical protein